MAALERCTSWVVSRRPFLLDGSYLGAAAHPGADQAEHSNDRCGQAVLAVVRRRPGLVSGKEAGKAVRRLREVDDGYQDEDGSKNHEADCDNQRGVAFDSG